MSRGRGVPWTDGGVIASGRGVEWGMGEAWAEVASNPISSSSSSSFSTASSTSFCAFSPSSCSFPCSSTSPSSHSLRRLPRRVCKHLLIFFSGGYGSNKKAGKSIIQYPSTQRARETMRKKACERDYAKKSASRFFQRFSRSGRLQNCGTIETENSREDLELQALVKKLQKSNIGKRWFKFRALL